MFSNAILLRSFNTNTFMNDVVIMEVGLKLVRKKSLSIGYTNYFNSGFELIFDKGKKML